jgi:heat shock protein HslJ
MATTVTNNPKVGSTGGDPLDALQVYTTRDSHGNVNVLVINGDPQHDIRATIAPGDAPHGQTAALTTLGSPNLTDENTPTAPTLVGIAEHTLNIGAGDFEVSFPKHSVTAVQLTTPVPVTEASPPLAGTEWRMLEFKGGGGLLVVPPGQRSRYIVKFNADHSVVTRMDCNQGRGTWESKEPPQLSLGTLALTRAMCPPGSLGAEFVKLWPLVHSYVIKDGHLNLSLLEDGGVLDLEPSNTQDGQ